MIDTIDTLQWMIPGSYGNKYRAVAALPDGRRRALRFAHAMHITWGAGFNNSILRQTGNIKNPETVLVEIQVQENSLLSVHCRHDSTILLYALEGHHFLHLQGYGPVPLFAATYTLQPITEGQHPLLITPGTCTLLYIIADELLFQLQAAQPALAPLQKYMAAAGKTRVLRLPVDTAVAALLQQLMELPEQTGPYALPFMASQLLLQIPKQLQAREASEQDIPARMMVFIAEHINRPVPWLLQQLQKRFSINRRLAATFLRSIHL
ncbi:MAG: hypothetical protein BGN92_13005 [Sphingobacteriales bacterium 41-5]|nr:MAG: hypothetical protein ABS67_03335 [Niabella sp. SCN 42-15]OJU27049.1 MAG: hypothetical protein BGN92_13005 [Sphingobacteriales bacterium 41-5]